MSDFHRLEKGYPNGPDDHAPECPVCETEGEHDGERWVCPNEAMHGWTECRTAPEPDVQVLTATLLDGEYNYRIATWSEYIEPEEYAYLEHERRIFPDYWQRIQAPGVKS